MEKKLDTFRRIAARQAVKYDERYREHGDNHLALGWPDEAENHKRFSIMASVIRWGNHIDHESGTRVALLDFGCGLGHFYEWLGDRCIPGIGRFESPLAYTGLDIKSEFTAVCRTKHPEVPFVTLDVLNDRDYAGLPPFDYIVCNGVFTEKLNTPWVDQWDYFMAIIERLWRRTRCGLAFNVSAVDCERDDLFDVPLDYIGDFIIHELGTRSFILRHDYNPWEYTTYVYK